MVSKSEWRVRLDRNIFRVSKIDYRASGTSDVDVVCYKRYVIRNGEEHADELVAYRTRRFSIYRKPRTLLIPLTRRHLAGFERERHSDMKSSWQLIARYRVSRA